jgi:hypothetical protein
MLKVPKYEMDVIGGGIQNNDLQDYRIEMQLYLE